MNFAQRFTFRIGSACKPNVLIGVRQQCQLTGALDASGHPSLVLGACVHLAARKNLASIRDEALQQICVLIIKRIDAGSTKLAASKAAGATLSSISQGVLLLQLERICPVRFLSLGSLGAT